MTGPAAPVDPARVDVVAPNLKRRLSGVTSTIVQLVPLQARRIGIAALGPGLPAELPRLRWWQLPALFRRPASGRKRVWHARRNVEMVVGVVLARVLRAPMHLLFTSAAQRDHKPFTKWLIRRMDRVVATSGRSASFLEVPNRVIMHGIDLERFRPAAGVDEGFGATGLPGQHAIGCFGRVRHQKGTDLFVDAMIALLPRYPNWTAVISGRTTAEHTDFERDLRRKVEQAGLAERIVFLGEVDDVTAWYRRLSLYVAPSRVEGFGLTPLEAMASGVAAVASTAGAYPELIVAGQTGAIFAAGDLGGLISAVGPYFADPTLAKEHGRAGQDHVRANFPLQRESDQLIEVYEALWAGERR